MSAPHAILALFAIALCCAIVGGTTWYDYRQDSKRQKLRERERAATVARIAELRRERIIRESRHAKRSDLDTELRDLVSAALADELGRR